MDLLMVMVVQEVVVVLEQGIAVLVLGVMELEEAMHSCIYHCSTGIHQGRTAPRSKACDLPSHCHEQRKSSDVSSHWYPHSLLVPLICTNG